MHKKKGAESSDDEAPKPKGHLGAPPKNVVRVPIGTPKEVDFMNFDEPAKPSDANNLDFFNNSTAP